jgi:DNA-binding transcriptional LysR family regulator
MAFCIESLLIIDLPPLLKRRSNTPRIVLEMALTRILAKLAWQHPRLTVEVSTGQMSVDIVAQGFDAGIRVRRAIQPDMITTRLMGSFKVILVASRDYLKAKSTPKSLADLHQHNCIGIRSVVCGAIRVGTDRGGKPTTVKTSGTALVTDMTEALSLALAGVSIAYVPEPLARRSFGTRALNGCCPKQRSRMMDCFCTILGALSWRRSFPPLLHRFSSRSKLPENRSFLKWLENLDFRTTWPRGQRTGLRNAAVQRLQSLPAEAQLIRDDQARGADLRDTKYRLVARG